MRIGFLDCDAHYPSAAGPPSAEFFRAYCRTHIPEFEVLVYDANAEQYPTRLDECRGYVIGGSPASVYEALPWIRRLQAFVQQLYEQRIPQVGICFGHQMLGQALGGRVARSPRGWGIGVRETSVDASAEWMRPRLAACRLLYSHQDQIELLPPQAEVLGGSAHCPYAMVLVGGRAFGIQGHPEFTRDFAEALMLSREDRIPPEVIEQALPTLESETDEAAVGRWIFNFFASRPPG